MEEKREHLYSYLKKNLSPERFTHSLGVEKAAVEMAERFGADPALCGIAGLGHDICREFSDEDLIKVTGKTHRHPVLLHGEAGALLLERDFKIKNPDILRAVRHHISGSPGLDSVGKIIFVSDYVEEGRTHLDRMERERLSSLELDDMVLSIALSIRDHLKGKNLPLEPALLHMIEELS